MLRYYVVPVIADPDVEGAVRPDVPAGTDLVGSTNGTTYLIATTGDLGGHGSAVRKLPDPALRNAAEQSGLRFRDVVAWRVRGESA